MNFEDIESVITAFEERNIKLLLTPIPDKVSLHFVMDKYDKNDICMKNISFLHIAVFTGAYDCVKYLLQSGIDPNFQDSVF
jgi:hypothetical protein